MRIYVRRGSACVFASILTVLLIIAALIITSLRTKNSATPAQKLQSLFLRRLVKLFDAKPPFAPGFYLERPQLDRILHGLRHCCEGAAARTGIQSITESQTAWLIMASSRKQERMRVALHTYAARLTHVYAFADEGNDTLRMRTLPELRGRPTYVDAQLRQLHGMRWMARNQRQLLDRVQWFVLADDDTWVDVDRLLEFLAAYPSGLPLAFGHAFPNGTQYYPEWASLSGGSGIVLSRAAFWPIANKMLSDECPLMTFNDVSVSQCCARLGVARVHEPRFNHYPPLAGDLGALRQARQLSFHKPPLFPEYLSNPPREQLVARARNPLYNDQL